MKRIRVEKLFGHLNYDIDLSDSNIIIITGPNGYGKTMLLSIIDNILNNNLDDLIPLKFFTIKAWLIDDTFIYIHNSGNDFTLKIVSSNGVDIYSKEININSSEQETSIFSNLSIKFKPISFLSDEKEKKVFKIPDDIFKEYIEKYRSTFIKTQRIQQDDENKNSICNRAKILSDLMSQVSEKSSIIAQSLDSTFPFRLSEKFNSRVSFQRTSNAKDRLLGVEAIKNKYNRYNLIETDEEGHSAENISFEAIREYSELWDLYIEDSLKKLNPFDELYKKLDLFASLIEEKFFSFKSLQINREKGFYFTSQLYDKEIIPLNKLSSGEQNQIILYFDMIFNSSKNSIILIDEPEISLHLGWQKEFYSSINTIVNLVKPAKIIIATHSPNIIDNNWDITRDLYSLSEGFNREN